MTDDLRVPLQKSEAASPGDDTAEEQRLRLELNSDAGHCFHNAGAYALAGSMFSIAADAARFGVWGLGLGFRVQARPPRTTLD